MSHMHTAGERYQHHTLTDVFALVVAADETAVVFDRISSFGTFREWHRAAVFAQLYPKKVTK